MADKGTGDTISSLWDGLSEHLIATFYEVDRQGEKAKDADGNTINTSVRAPLTESSLDASMSWQSAFDSLSPETKSPTLYALFQSGAVQPAVDAVNAIKAGKPTGPSLDNANAGAGASAQTARTALKNIEGRAGITKLNSTQVFSGMPPIKIQVTALFRAWRDPVNEVIKPVDQLMAWAFPERISADNQQANLGKAGQSADAALNSAIDILLPSKTPRLLAMLYKNRTYKPLVIESISLPLSSPINQDGNFTELLVPMTLTTLTAWDAADWANSKL
ncbi:MAG: hypothetical protein PHU14_05385 [Methylovulum sp.]|nr:hypothetical protein [Methylovulum sp.]